MLSTSASSCPTSPPPGKIQSKTLLPTLLFYLNTEKRLPSCSEGTLKWCLAVATDPDEAHTVRSNSIFWTRRSLRWSRCFGCLNSWLRRHSKQCSVDSHSSTRCSAHRTSRNEKETCCWHRRSLRWHKRTGSDRWQRALFWIAAWECIGSEVGFGRGSTCRRRLNNLRLVPLHCRQAESQLRSNS